MKHYGLTDDSQSSPSPPVMGVHLSSRSPPVMAEAVTGGEGGSAAAYGRQSLGVGIPWLQPRNEGEGRRRTRGEERAVSQAG